MPVPQLVAGVAAIALTFALHLLLTRTTVALNGDGGDEGEAPVGEMAEGEMDGAELVRGRPEIVEAHARIAP